MKVRFPFSVVLLGALLAAGCTAEHAPAPAVVQRNRLSIPALPIIQEAVLSLAPNFAGGRNPQLMGQICGLARGTVAPQQIEALASSQMGAKDAGNYPYSLLSSNDRAAQSTACAAYLASSVLSAVDIGEFTKPVGAASPAQTEDRRKAKPNSAPTPPAAAKASRQIDQVLLAQVLPVKLAEARTNADVFALIASEMQRRPNLTIIQYRELAQQLFQRLAPTYLSRLEQAAPPAGTVFNLAQLDNARFAFTASVGSSFEYTSDGLTLRQSGILWYGQGKLLGQDFPLQVTYFPDSVNALLAP